MRSPRVMEAYRGSVGATARPCPGAAAPILVVQRWTIMRGLGPAGPGAAHPFTSPFTSFEGKFRGQASGQTARPPHHGSWLAVGYREGQSCIQKCRFSAFFEAILKLSLQVRERGVVTLPELRAKYGIVPGDTLRLVDLARHPLQLCERDWVMTPFSNRIQRILVECQPCATTGRTYGSSISHRC